MSLDAKQFVDNAEMLAPWIEKLAVLTGNRVLSSLATVLRRATENPDTKEQLVAWLRWTPIFTGADAGQPEPELPTAYADLQEQLVDVRVGCNNCDDGTDCSDPPSEA